MGLFSKKQKVALPPHLSSDPAPRGAERPTQPQVTSRVEGKRSKKVDPVAFYALQDKLAQLQTRLDAAERDKAVVEHRLSALDATTSVLAGAPPTSEHERVDADSDALRAKLEELEQRIAAATEAAAHPPSDVAELAGHTAHAPDEELLARIDALSQRVDEVSGIGPHIEELQTKLADVSAKLDEHPAVSREGAPLPPPSESDVAQNARLDALQERLGTIDALSTQLTQMNARVTAQGEMGAKLSSLADRISQLQARTDGTYAALRDQVQQLNDRPNPTDGATRLDRPTGIDEVAALREQIASIPERPDHSSDLDHLRGQIELLHQRPDHSDALDDIHDQLFHLHQRPDHAATIAEHAVALADQRAAVAEQSSALAARDTALDELRSELVQLRQRADATDNLAVRVDSLTERLDAYDDHARQSAGQLAALDGRLSNIGTELANQLSELGRDIDDLANQPAPAVAGEHVDVLRTGQVKLANEQARYEIAFRQDLATLAEQVRRSNGR